MKMVAQPVYANHIHDRRQVLSRKALNATSEWMKLGWGGGPVTLAQVKPSVYCQFVDRCVTRLFSHLLQTKCESYVNYYKTILRCSNASSTVVMTSLIYLTRLGAKSSHLLFLYPPHLIYTVLLMLAFTHVEDAPYHTKSWAEVSTFSVPLLNSVVREVLAAFDYRLVVDRMHFAKWEASALKYFQSIPASCIKPAPLSFPPQPIMSLTFTFEDWASVL